MYRLHLSLLTLLQIWTLLPFSIFGDSPEYAECSKVFKFPCGSLSLNISYPFIVDGRPDYCGVPGHNIACVGNKPVMQLHSRGYIVKAIDYGDGVITLAEMKPMEGGDSCPDGVEDTIINPALFDFTMDVELLWLFSCQKFYDENNGNVSRISWSPDASGLQWHFMSAAEAFLFKGICNLPAKIPLNRSGVMLLRGGRARLWDALSQGFDLDWKAGGGWCCQCRQSGGVCGYTSSKASQKTCFCRDGTREKSCTTGRRRNVKLKVIIAVAALVVGFLLALGGVTVWLKRRQGKVPSGTWRNFLSRSPLVDPSSFVKDPESLGDSYFYTPTFTYEELEVATGGFDSSKELGDGGFGVVYKGVLKDGRVVAVKRLHERNYRRVQQFRNEVEILNRIRHPNLVSLYGCTNSDNRELLLVYEYIPNGTLADHLHGSRASERLLTWPIRLTIASETAAALSYLHATEPQIIHRDVKTSNILLDKGFHVKVGDFGLSRAFPSPLTTHVSTAPQGTPGYVDPEYHQCYQLTDKSDVYSFGVVLVELASSKPAVDMDRPRSEINLSNMAMAKIPRGLMHELVDSTLGFDTDPEVRRTIEAVAELAFRCLQPLKDMRPSMDEVRYTLEKLHRGDQRTSPVEREKHARGDTCSLLKPSSGVPPSPDTVVGNWPSRSTFSGGSS